MIDYKELYMEELPFATRLANWIAYYYEPRIVFDIGCGPGVYTHELIKRGIKAIGFDTDKRIEGDRHLVYGDILDFQGRTDLILCIEVAEHIDAKHADTIVKNLSNALMKQGLLIWSAAQPGQGGDGHINCQPKQYWIDKFVKAGLKENKQLTEELLTYCKQGPHMGWFINNGVCFNK